MGNIAKSLREQESTFRKKMVRMKGQWTPRGVIRICGWLHRKKNLLEETDKGFTSPFMVSRQADFASYSARLYEITAKLLKKYQRKQERLELQIKYIIEEMEAYEEQLISEPVEQKDKRYNVKLIRMMNSLQEEYQEKEQMRMEILQVIDASQLETEEIKYSMKSRVEAQLYNYLQGAHCFYASCLPELVENEETKKLYENYCQKRIVQKMTVSEKEADDYVVETI